MNAHRRRTSILLATIACAGALALARPAAACGMIIWQPPAVSPKAAPLLLVAAGERMRAGALPQARRLADRVARSHRVAAAQRAEAYTLLAWIDWRLGAGARAHEFWQRARALDGTGATVERVIARSGSADLQARFRAAVAG